ncbi:MAG: hypothetical protein K6F55_02470 [Eubacterium sp.]|nr:hypothetical protein [Eubacterium sp.]
MEKDEIRSTLKSLIEDSMPELSDVDLEKDIVKEYGINSVSIIKLIIDAENKFGVKFTDYELSLDGYATFGDMVEVIKEKLDSDN